MSLTYTLSFKSILNITWKNTEPLVIEDLYTTFDPNLFQERNDENEWYNFDLIVFFT